MKKWSLLLFIVLSDLVYSNSVSYLPVPSKELVRHSYYTLSYNEKYEQANWVYYVLTDSMVIAGGQERSNKFKADMLVPTGSAKSADYTKSGYDRGHLCPAADMDFNAVAMQESFLMSNISPQAPEFNRGIWKDLEAEVREWAKKKHKLYVVTGPVFSDSKGTIGENEVLIPGYFYKVLYAETNQPEVIAFVLPNQKSDRPLSDFVVPVDELEKITGFDFLSQLPDDIENRLESASNLVSWETGNEPALAKAAQKSVAGAMETQPLPLFYIVLALVLVLVIVFIATKGRKRK